MDAVRAVAVRAVAVFLAWLTPWLLYHARPLHFAQRYSCAALVAAVVYPLSLAMRWDGAHTQAAAGSGMGTGLAILGWSIQSRMLADIRKRRKAGLPLLVEPETRRQFYSPVYEIKYRWRMSFDEQSKAWMDEDAPLRRFRPRSHT